MEALLAIYDTWVANERPRDADGAPRVTDYSHIELKNLAFGDFVEKMEMREYARSHPPSDRGPARIVWY